MSYLNNGYPLINFIIQVSQVKPVNRLKQVNHV